MALLTIAFAYSAILISSSISEAKDNPVASIIEIVPSTSVPFPTVTVYPGRRNVTGEKTVLSHRFAATALNMYRYGCRISDGGNENCEEETRETRKGFFSLSVAAMDAIVGKWTELTPEGKHPWLLDDIALYRFPGVNELCKLTETQWKDSSPSVMDTRAFVYALAEVVEMPWRTRALHIKDFLYNMTLKSNVTNDDSCGYLSDERMKELMTDYDFALWANILVYYFFIRAYEPNLKLGDALQLYKYSLYDQDRDYRFNHLNELVFTNLDDVMSSLCGTSDQDCAINTYEIFNYLELYAKSFLWLTNEGGLKTFNSAFQESPVGSLCGPKMHGEANGQKEAEYYACLQENVKKNWSYMFRILKHTYQPVSSSIEGSKYLADFERALKLGSGSNYSLLCDPTKTACKHSDPLLGLCYFGYSETTLEQRDQSDDCTFFKMIFAYNGLAYTFNGPDFWSMYSNSTFNQAFFSEIHNQDETESGEDYSNSAKKLEFYIFPEALEGYEGTVSNPSLAIHHKYHFPMLSTSLEVGYR